MPDKKNIKKPIPEDIDQVKFVPIFGIKPGIYLSALYGILILFLLFLVFFLPGIRNPGSVLSIRSEPWGAAVRINGVYSGSAPVDIFVPKGQHNIEISLPGFISENFEHISESRIFASLFFPKKTEHFSHLSAHLTMNYLANEGAEFAEWSFAGEPGSIYQIPQSLSEGIYRFAPDLTENGFGSSINDLLKASARFAHTRAGLRDLIRAKTFLDNEGLSPSPLSLLSSAADILEFLNDNPRSALWLGSLLTTETQQLLLSSSWYSNTIDDFTHYDTITPVWGGTVQTLSITFRFINGGSFGSSLPNSINFPSGTEVDSFYISETVINRAAWNLFLENNPLWRRENLDLLLREGLVNDDYLDPAIFPGSPPEGVSGISWYSVTAFCEWLTSFLPANLSDWEIRLPTEAEWEYALGAGLANTGRFWEWCEDYYAPLSFLYAPASAINMIGSPQRSLRGSSWINSSITVGSLTRASLPPDHCSPFVSARPVIALRRSN